VQPIEEHDPALACLKTSVKDLLMFFAHGHTEFAGAERLGSNRAQFIEMYEQLPQNSALRKSWKDAYDDAVDNRYKSDESWIKLQYGKLLLTELYKDLSKRFSASPVVFLNMCESAQLTPSLNLSFIHLFLNRGACSVIGTECSMRPLFAHYFGIEILKGLFAGDPIGEVLLRARLAFMGKNNPMGLAYTLFGSPLTRFEPAPLPREPRVPGGSGEPQSKEKN